MSELKLLPCPFCGGEAKIVRYCGKKAIVYVECTNCLAYMGNQRINTSSSRGKEYFESEDKLINAWNRRTPMANIVEKLEELKKDSSQGCEKVNQELCNSYFDCGLCLIDRIIDIVKQDINKEN